MSGEPAIWWAPRALLCIEQDCVICYTSKVHYLFIQGVILPHALSDLILSTTIH